MRSLSLEALRSGSVGTAPAQSPHLRLWLLSPPPGATPSPVAASAAPAHGVAAAPPSPAGVRTPSPPGCARMPPAGGKPGGHGAAPIARNSDLSPACGEKPQGRACLTPSLTISPWISEPPACICPHPTLYFPHPRTSPCQSALKLSEPCILQGQVPVPMSDSRSLIPRPSPPRNP